MYSTATAPFQLYPPLRTVTQLLHFKNILHYAQYNNCSISIISCTMHSTATAPFQ